MNTPQIRVAIAAIALLQTCLTADATLAQSITTQPAGQPGSTDTIIDAAGNQYNITGGIQNAGNLFHSLQDFGLSPSEIATFISNPSVQNILTRVVGGNVSIIEGLIQVTGGNSNLFLMNPAGVVFSDQAQLNVPASFQVTTANAINLGDRLFNAFGANDYSLLVGSPSAYTFTNEANGSIINQADLSVNSGQTLSLVGSTVINGGSLTAPGGQVQLMAVPEAGIVRLNQSGMVLGLDLAIPIDQTPNAVPATIQLQSLPELLTGGAFQAASQLVLNPDGGISLTGSSHSIMPGNGLTIASGIISTDMATDTTTAGSSGGFVQVLGDRVGLFNATIEASGPSGGGTILIGGEYLGQGDTPTATQTFGDQATSLTANALNAGDGGRVIVWADDATRFYGSISAQGGSTAGNGGLIETSGKNFLDVAGIQVTTAAPNGEAGLWLLDPRNVTIEGPPGNTFPAAGVFIPTVDDASINAADITAALAVTNVTINTGFSGTQAGNITVNSAIAPTFINGNLTLTLDAANDIIVNADIDDADTISSHTLNVTFNAGGDIDTTGATIDTSKGTGSTLTGGNVTFTAGGDINTGTIITGTTSSAAAGPVQDLGGNVTLTAGGNLTTGSINTSSIYPTTVAGIAKAESGDVTLTAGGTATIGDITATSIARGTAAETVAASGTVNITSGGPLTVGAIRTDASAFETDLSLNGFTEVTGGTVNLQTADTLGNDITFTSIDASALAVDPENDPLSFAQGGNVRIAARGTIQGTGTTTGGETINTAATFSGSSAITSGTVELEHDGGPNNIDFVIGDASQNGLASSINAGSSDTLTSGSFPVLASTGTATGTPGRITIRSINSAPTLTTATNAATVQLPTGTPVNFTLQSLGLSVTDPDGDRTGFQISNILQGVLVDADNNVLATGSIITSDQTLTYIPAEGSIFALVDAFTLVAFDISNDSATTPLATSNTLTIQGPETDAITILEAIDGDRNFDLSSSCPTDCIDDLDDFPPTPLIADRRQELVTLYEAREAALREDYANYFGEREERVSLQEAQELLRTIEDLTGAKPAILYPGFEPLVAPTSLASHPAQPAQAQTRIKALSAATTSPTPNILWEFTETGLAIDHRSGPILQSQQFNQQNSQPATKLEIPPAPTDQLSVLVVTAEGNPIYQRITGVTRSRFEAATRLFQQQVSSPANTLSNRYLLPSQLLYEWLIAEIEAELEQRDIDNLVFALPSGLRGLPVAALHDGEQFLVQEYSVGAIPSLSFTDTRYRNIRDVSMLAMGASEFEAQIPLPAVDVELEEIYQEWDEDGKVFTNQQFTSQNLRSEIDQSPYGIVHLATHADFRSGPPSNSFIQFFGRDRVTLPEISTLVTGSPTTLPIELLVLSACKTGIGSDDLETVIGSELGFGGAAYAAGVKSVLGSLWEVSDAATAGLMIEFYGVLRQDGIIKAEALRQAQVAMATGALELEGDALRTLSRGQRSSRLVTLPNASVRNLNTPDFSHPYYWAAFTMIGNPW